MNQSDKAAFAQHERHWLEPDEDLPTEYMCPTCGKLIGWSDNVFLQGGEYVGCEYCVTPLKAEDVLDE